MTSSEISYAEAQSNLSGLLDRVADSKEVVVIKHHDRGIALIAEEDLSSLLETVYLLRSPANAARLHGAIERMKKWKPQDSGVSTDATEAIADLCKELGVVRQKES
jgi:antitoxin YefM